MHYSEATQRTISYIESDLTEEVQLDKFPNSPGLRAGLTARIALRASENSCHVPAVSFSKDK